MSQSLHWAAPAASQQNSKKKKGALRVVGQDMQIMNPEFFRILAAQDSCGLAAMARRQVEAGADALDLNLGPTKKNSRLFAWAVQTIQEAVPVPLFLASQILSQPEVLHAHQGRPVINSVTADPAMLAAAMRQAKDCNAELAVLLVRPGCCPLNAEDRLRLAAEVLETAEQLGFPLSDLYLDPLFRLRSDPAVWKLAKGLPDVSSVLETLAALPLLSPGVRTVVALSSASQFLPAAERPAFHRLLLPLLTAAGLDAVILNCKDRQLMAVARSQSSAKSALLEAAAQF